MPADAKAYGADRGTRGVSLQIVACFEVIEHRGGRHIEMCHGRGMGQMVAMHATGVVVSDYQTGWAGSIIDFRRRHHEPMPGQAVCRSTYRSRQLKYLRVQNDARILTARLRGFRSGNVGSAGEAVNGQFDVRRGDLHFVGLPQSN